MPDLTRRQLNTSTLAAIGAAALGGSAVLGARSAAAALTTTYYSNFSDNRYYTYPHQNGLCDSYKNLVLGQLEADSKASLWKHDVASGTTTRITRAFTGCSFGSGKRSYVYYDVHANSNLVAFSAEDKVWLANLSGDANVRVLYTPPAGNDLDDLVGMHPSGTHVVAAYRPTGKTPPTGTTTIVQIKISDGSVTTLCTLSFYANHVHYSRNDPSWVGFSNEGSSSDRIWAWHATSAPNGKALWNGKTTAGSQLAIGHETWMPHNSTSAFAVAYPGTGTPQGIYEVKTDGTHRLVKEGGFWHIGTSWDGAYICADTTGGKIQVLDVSTGALTDLYTTGSGSHPKHPHPHLSRGYTSVIFNDTNGSGQVRVVSVKFR